MGKVPTEESIKIADRGKRVKRRTMEIAAPSKEQGNTWASVSNIPVVTLVPVH